MGFIENNIYYPFANVFGNALILKKKLANSFQVFVEKNEGFDGDMTIIAQHDDQDIDIDVIENSQLPGIKIPGLCEREST